MKYQANRRFSPAIHLLHEYDVSNHTYLLETLTAFTRNERRYQQTSAILKLHRNTVIKRMGVASELLGTTFESAYEREYLLYSLRYREYANNR